LDISPVDIDDALVIEDDDISDDDDDDHEDVCHLNLSFVHPCYSLQMLIFLICIPDYCLVINV